MPELDISITAGFDSTMEGASINASTFTLASAAGPVSGSVTFDADSNIAIFKPSANLTVNTVYTATLSESIRNIKGETLGLPYSWSFTTSTSTVTGTLDASFGTDGIAVISNADGCNAITVDSLGRILVAGFSSNLLGLNTNTTMTVWRFNPNGTLDIGFGDGGISKQSGSAAGGSTSFTLHDNAVSIILTADDKILVGGFSFDPGGNGVSAIWRLNPDGSLDTSFNSTGILLPSLPELGGQVLSGALSPNVTMDDANRILITGNAVASVTAPVPAEHHYMIVMRYNPDGSLDSTLSDGTHNGFVLSPGEGVAIATDAGGKIIVAGSPTETSTPTPGLRIWKISSEGNIDQIFNNYGANISGIFKIDPDGPIYTRGPLSIDSIYRYNSNGTLDTSFGDNGSINVSNVISSFFMALDPAGRLLVTRLSRVFSSPGPLGDYYKYYIETMRFNTNGTTDESFGSSGKAIYPDYEPPEELMLESSAVTTDLYNRVLVLGRSIQSDSTPISILCYK